MRPVVIAVAITGSVPRKRDNPAVTVAVAEQIESTHEAFEAGASLVHIHVRNADESPSSSSELFARVQEGVRQCCSGMIIQFSTGGRGRDPSARGSALYLKPDMGSLSTGSVNFPTIVYENSAALVRDLATRMHEYGVRPEIEIFDLSHIHGARRLVDERLVDDRPHVQFVLGVQNAMPPEEHLLDILLGELKRVLPNATWTAAGIGRHQHKVIEWVLARGGEAIRTGLEDNIRITRDRLAEQQRRTRQGCGGYLRAPRSATCHTARDESHACLAKLTRRQKRADRESEVWSNSRTRVLSMPTPTEAKEGGRTMFSSTRAVFFGAIAGSTLLAGLGQALASEPANLGNFLPGNTMGAPIAAAPPPGLWFASTAFYLPMVSGNGNAGCGPGCKERYNAVGATVNLTWGSGWKFLGADYYPTIQTGAFQATATVLPYPPGGGVLQSPIYGNIFDHEIANLYVNPLNFSWNLGKGLYVAAGLGFVAPAGSTYAGSLVPDYWTVRPHAAVSYLGEGWNLTVSALYDINTASEGRTGLYQVIARNPATAPAVAVLFGGPNSPGRGYTSGNYLYVDWTATHKFGSWEFGPVGFFKFQTTDDSPGGINPATRSAWTCAQLTIAKLPSCGKDVNIGAGLLIGYNFGPVDMKFIYANAFYSRDTVGSNTGSEFFLKTSFKLWSPEEAPKKTLITK